MSERPPIIDFTEWRKKRQEKVSPDKGTPKGGHTPVPQKLQDGNTLLKRDQLISLAKEIVADKKVEKEVLRQKERAASKAEDTLYYSAIGSGFMTILFYILIAIVGGYWS